MFQEVRGTPVGGGDHSPTRHPHSLQLRHVLHAVLPALLAEPCGRQIADGVHLGKTTCGQPARGCLRVAPQLGHGQDPLPCGGGTPEARPAGSCGLSASEYNA